jgi:trimeric autotransporter adhesin
LAILGNTVFIGGGFSIVNGQDQRWVAKLDAITGNLEVGWQPDIQRYVSSTNRVKDIVAYGNHVYVAGEFSSITFDNRQTQNSLARLHISNGNPDFTWSPDINCFGGGCIPSVERLLVTESGIYFLGGANTYRFGKLNLINGQYDTKFKSGVGDLCIAVQGDKLFSGGDFEYSGYPYLKGIFRINKSNQQLDTTWKVKAEITELFSIIVENDDVYLSGSINFLQSNPPKSIIKVNRLTGELDPNWQASPNLPLRNAVSWGNHIYIIGNFTQVNNKNIKYIARLDKATGLPDTT